MFYTMLLMQAESYAPQQSDYWWRFIQWLIPAIPIIAFYILLAFCIYRAAKYFGSATKEQKLLRMEMSKLAEEVHLLRREMKGTKDSQSD